jgi:hypothetical protein
MTFARLFNILLLSLLLQTCAAPTPAAAQSPQPKQPAAAILSDEVAKIAVFPPCTDSIDELTAKRRPCPLEVVYELQQDLAEGHMEVFNLLHVEAQYPLPDLSAGKHILVIPDALQAFYWAENDQTVPEPMLFCNLGTGSTSMMLEDLWGAASSSKSLYDYKPPPPPKKFRDPTDLAAAFRGDDLGFAEFKPSKRNLELRDSAQLPEVEILGVGFVEGTPVECGQGVNPERFFKSPLRDVRVVSTLAHDADNSIPVLKAARFTVPQGMFAYPNHLRIIGKLKAGR